MLRGGRYCIWLFHDWSDVIGLVAEIDCGYSIWEAAFASAWNCFFEELPNILVFHVIGLVLPPVPSGDVEESEPYIEVRNEVVLLDEPKVRDGFPQPRVQTLSSSGAVNIHPEVRVGIMNLTACVRLEMKPIYHELRAVQ